MKTRRRSSTKKQKSMTIPDLKRAFDQMEKKAAHLNHGTMAEKVKEFQRHWKSIFGREVSKSAAEAYLAVKKSEKKGTRKMRGGALLAGAPLDFQMRPGSDGPPFSGGIYPTYVTSGLTDINNLASECGPKDVPIVLPEGLGSNKVGGGTIPTTFYQDLQTAYQGGQLPPSPAAEARTWNYK